jgi:polyisoprenyl-phosphate glycosyltransferase
VLIAFFGSLNLLAIATVGEYLIKIFEETKRRPKFIRKAVLHGGKRLTVDAEIGEFLERRRQSVAARSASESRGVDGDAG